MTGARAAGAFAAAGVVALAGAARVAARSGLDARARRRLARAVPRRPRSLPDPPAWLAARVPDGALAMSLAGAWWLWVAGTVGAALVAARAGGPVLALIASAVSAGAGGGAVAVARHAAARRYEAAIPESLEAIARELRTGASLRQAVAGAAPAVGGEVGAELARIAVAAERGLSISEALEQWRHRRPSPGVRLAVAALCLAGEVGGAQARAVDGVALTLRQRLGAAAEARALAAQARLSAVVIALAPVAFAGLAAATDPRTSAFLLRTPLGLAFVGAGLTLDGVGAWWMARITRVAA